MALLMEFDGRFWILVVVKWDVTADFGALKSANGGDLRHARHLRSIGMSFHIEIRHPL